MIMKTNKEMVFDKEYVKVKKDTFDSMNKVIKETKKVAELQPKIKKVYDEVDTYTKSYKALEKENDNIYHELEILEYKNDKLEKENSRLKRHLEAILKAIKEFFRHILKIGNEQSKQEVVYQITDYYDNNDFEKSDVYNIAIDTDKEEELFDYCEIDNDFVKENDYDDFEI